MSFISSLLNVLSSFTVNITSGFGYLPVTKIRTGSAFTDMQYAVNYADQNGNYFQGQQFGSNNPLIQGNYQQQPKYQPQQTTPPVTFPTFQSNGYVVPTGANQASMYQASSECYRHIRNFEGLHQRPYYVNGQKFIGYGHQLPQGDTTTYISRDQAESFLTQDVGTAQGTVQGAISVQLSQTQFDALVDFAYTVSSSAFTGSDVVSKFNSGDVGGACTALMQWSYISLNNVVQRSDHLTSRRTGNVRWMSMSVDPQPLSAT